MKLFNQWVDFVVYPLDPVKVETLEERLDISRAIRVSHEDAKRLKREDYDSKVETMQRTGQRVCLEDFVTSGDKFECIGIDATGNVWVWTQNLVCFLQRLGGTERLVFLPRNPVDFRA